MVEDSVRERVEARLKPTYLGSSTKIFCRHILYIPYRLTVNVIRDAMLWLFMIEMYPIECLLWRAWKNQDCDGSYAMFQQHRPRSASASACHFCALSEWNVSSAAASDFWPHKRPRIQTQHSRKGGK